MSKRERLRRAKIFFPVYPIGDGEKEKKKTRSSDKKGARDGIRTHVGMGKGFNLHSKEQESTNHQSGHTKRHWGRGDCQCTRRHLIRKPAKLTGTRHELCTSRGVHQTWCG
jgi:hypothetical protein